MSGAGRASCTTKRRLEAACGTWYIGVPFVAEVAEEVVLGIAFVAGRVEE